MREYQYLEESRRLEEERNREEEKRLTNKLNEYEQTIRDKDNIIKRLRNNEEELEDKYKGEIK